MQVVNALVGGHTHTCTHARTQTPTCMRTNNITNGKTNKGLWNVPTINEF